MIMYIERYLIFLFMYRESFVLLISMNTVKCSQKPVFHDLTVFLPDVVYFGSLDMCSMSPTISQNNLCLTNFKS